MKLEGEQTLLRVYLRNTDKAGWKSAADALVGRARERHLAGATVLEGVYGLDADGHVLESSVWSFVEHRPVIVEIVDEPRKIGAFLQDVFEIIPEGMVSLERAHVLVYRHGQGEGGRAVLGRTVPARVPDLSAVPSPEEMPEMKLSEDGQLLRVFIGEADAWEGQPLYRAVVLKAKELGLAGATVLRGPVGFGANSRVHSAGLLELSTDLPLIVEIVDTAENIERLLPFLDDAVGEGLITIEAVRVLRYRHNDRKLRP